MGELSRRSGIPVPTLRHYLRRGLLPPAEPDRPNRFLYGPSHLQAAQLVRLLRERRRLSLSEIGAILPSLLSIGETSAFRPAMWEQLASATALRPDQRSRLVSAAADAFRARGFAAVHVEEVARAAGIAKGSFYRHFRSKEELYAATLHHVVAEATTALADSLAARDRARPADPTAPTDREETTRLLAAALRGALPLLTDLLAMAARAQPDEAALAAHVFARLRHEVAQVVGVTEGASGRIVGEALLAGIADVLGGAAPTQDRARRQAGPA